MEDKAYPYLVVVDDVYCQNTFVVGFGTETEAKVFEIQCLNAHLDASIKSVHRLDDPDDT